jgi:hypothetical protein
MNNRTKAIGRMKQGKMNNLERAYAQRLELLKASGKILWYAFEAMKFRLADSTFYTPDFMVLNADSSLEAHEVKGFWMDDARVKIKVANEIFPVQFIAVQRKKGLWVFELFGEDYAKEND